MCAASGIEQLPAGVSTHEVAGLSFCVNNSDQSTYVLDSWQITARQGVNVVASFTPSTALIEWDADAFVALMRSTLPVDHHLFAPPVEGVSLPVLDDEPVIEPTDGWTIRA
jgi:hypothetical protein